MYSHRTASLGASVPVGGLQAKYQCEACKRGTGIPIEIPAGYKMIKGLFYGSCPWHERGPAAVLQSGVKCCRSGAVTIGKTSHEVHRTGLDDLKCRQAHDDSTADDAYAAGAVEVRSQRYSSSIKRCISRVQMFPDAFQG